MSFLGLFPFLVEFQGSRWFQAWPISHCSCDAGFPPGPQESSVDHAYLADHCVPGICRGAWCEVCFQDASLNWLDPVGGSGRPLGEAGFNFCWKQAPQFQHQNTWTLVLGLVLIMRHWPSHLFLSPHLCFLPWEMGPWLDGFLHSFQL